MSSENNTNKFKFGLDEKHQKITILLILLITALGLILILVNINKSNSRTIMIYMAGNDLESDGAIATSDLEAINPKKINLKNNKILIYTGGTKKWFNFIESDENAIYELKENGFEKVKSFPQKNMGSPEVFKEFLTYSYNNYKTDKYDLIMWNHGLGSLGTISDEYTNDYLTLNELEKAFSESPFNHKKISTLAFHTCLNSTIEMAAVLHKYVNYMIASEEVTWGATNYNVLGYLNDIDKLNNDYDYARTYIASYIKQMNELGASKDITYSILNLNKYEKIEKDLNNFIKNVNLESNYNDIAKIRSNIHQYGLEHLDYDTVDLYELISLIKNYSKSDSKKLLTSLKEFIKYNWTNNEHSNGVSVYFPYNGNDTVKKLHLDVYNNLNYLTDYKYFINNFYKKQANAKPLNYKTFTQEISSENNEFKLKLNEEQISNFARANYIIFEKHEDNYFTPIYVSKNAYLTDDGYVKTKLGNNLIKVSDIESDESSYLQIISSDNNIFQTNAIAMNFIEEYGAYNLKMNFKIENDSTVIESTEVYKDNDITTTGLLVDYKNYDSIQFTNFRYKILDDNGNYQEKWESNSTKWLFEIAPKKNGYKFELSNLKDSKNKNLYCLFKIYDINNNYYYSNLINIEN